MILQHARARAFSAIFRSSEPETIYPKDAIVPDPDAEDWEPNQYQPPVTVVSEDDLTNGYDCGCDKPQTGEVDEDDRRREEG